MLSPRWTLGTIPGGKGARCKQSRKISGTGMYNGRDKGGLAPGARAPTSSVQGCGTLKVAGYIIYLFS